MTEAELKRAWQSTATRSHGEACPTLDEIEALIHDRLDPTRRDAVVEALATCADCALIAQLSQEVSEAAHASVAAVTRGASETIRFPPRSARRRHAAPRWAMAMAACVCVAVVALMIFRPTHEADVLRGSGAPAGIEPAQAASLAAAPERLRWAASAGDARYRVELFDPRAELVWRSGWLTQPQVELDAATREKIAHGSFVWRVRIEGATESVRGPYRFDVDP